MNFDPGKLIIIIIGTLFLGAFAWLSVRGGPQRLMLLALLSGVALYSGLGAADVAVSWDFIFYYFVFMLSIIFGFHLGRPMFLSASIRVGRKLPSVLDELERKRGWQFVIVAYVLLSVYPFVWPEIRVHQLISPPPPDLLTVFSRRFTDGPLDVLSRILEYIRLLMTPFFYTALYAFRSRMKWIAVVFVLLLYLNYADNSSIGRGYVVSHLGFLYLAFWLLRPRLRKFLVVFGLMAIPLVFFGLYYYRVIRIGGEFAAVPLGDMVLAILSVELGFLRNVGQPLLDMGARVDLGMYFIWIFTLPIPKIIAGPVEGARINHEISEIVLGLPVGAPGWYVVLPGLVAESIYIYGPYFFWLHGIFIGMLAAFFARVTERVPQLLFLHIYLVFMFFYFVNRGGISGLLPAVINEFLLFYAFLFWAVLRRKRNAQTSSQFLYDHPFGR